VVILFIRNNNMHCRWYYSCDSYENDVEEESLWTQTAWTSVDEALPEIDITRSIYLRHTKVLVCWGPCKENTAGMSYVEKEIRGKLIRRFEWQGRISPWIVLYWMHFPDPPNFKKEK
jgi:hypothetical protein